MAKINKRLNRYSEVFVVLINTEKIITKKNNDENLYENGKNNDIIKIKKYIK